MSLIASFAAYAAAFEESFESDDWSHLAPFFDEDAIYLTGTDFFGSERVAGRAAILDYFKSSLDGFDRRFAKRTLRLLEGPFEEGSTVRIVGDATYEADGLPDLVLALEERVTFENGRIAVLEDRYEAQMTSDVNAYFAAHGEALGIAAQP